MQDLAFDQNYLDNEDKDENDKDFSMRNNDNSQNLHKDNDDESLKSTSGNNFFMKEQRPRTLTKVPKLSVEERKKRIGILKHCNKLHQSPSKKVEKENALLLTP